MNRTFTLIKNQSVIGSVHWTNRKQGVFILDHSGEIQGDAAAVNAINGLVAQSAAEQWKDVFPTSAGLYDLNDPLTYPTQLLSLLIHGGYEIPPELQQMYDNLCGNWDTGGIDVDF